MPAEGEPIGSCGGAPGNEPAYPRPGAPAHETDPTISSVRSLVLQYLPPRVLVFSAEKRGQCFFFAFVFACLERQGKAA